MENEPTGNVTQLSAYRKSNSLTERQQVVRDRLLDKAQRPASEAPTAMIGITVLPNGHIRSVAIQIEPEHVMPVLSAMRVLMTRLESCLTESITARHLIFCLIAVALILGDSIGEPAIAGFLR